MPEISRFYGIIIRMYCGDHAPPHFHAVYGEYEAFIAIDTGQVVHGYIPNTALRLVQTWAQQHRTELRELWESAIQLQPLKKVAPLE